MKRLPSLSAPLLLAILLPAIFLTSAAAQSQPYPVEYYYKVKWGSFNEFLELYKKNHYPILVKLQQQGDILDMWAATPVYHAGEPSRWDFRFTIVWRDVETAFREDRGEERIVEELYPEAEEFRREERRRFQLLLEHQDVPVRRDDLSSWQKVP